MPGEISLVVKNDDGTVRSSLVVGISQGKLKSIREWRQAQVLTHAVPETKDEDGNLVSGAKPEVLRWGSDNAMWRSLLTEWIKAVTGDSDEALGAVKAERAKIAEAQAAIEAIKAGQLT